MEMFGGFPVRSGFAGPGWELEDCAAVAATLWSFEVPSPDEASRVAVGDLLRLHFLLTDPDVTSDPGSPRAERMWVEVCARSDGGVFRGHLTNMPAFISSLDPGDVVEFMWKHVAQVYIKAGDPGHAGERA